VSRHIPDTGISIGIYRIKRQSDKYIVITDIDCSAPAPKPTIMAVAQEQMRVGLVLDTFFAP